MAKVLVIRLSSLGDVAMLVPVMVSVASKYPQSRFTVMTRAAFAPLFNELTFNVSVIPVETTRKHKGIIGLLRIIGKVLFRGYSHVADEHDVLRSKIIRLMMRISGCKVRHIDKGRGEKQEMISTKKVFPPLEHTVDRYFDTFKKLGFPAKMISFDFFDFKLRDMSALKDLLPVKNKSWIGIAPFAKHKGKIYPPDKMESIINTLVSDGKMIFLLGGKEDIPVFDKWKQKYPDNIVNTAGLLSLEKELLLVSYMDVVISMDSANMHLASLVNVPVISVWGATHPSLGFYGLNQEPANAAQIDLECRPCSVYGEKPCERIDYACLEQLPETLILEKVNKILSEKYQDKTAHTIQR